MIASSAAAAGSARVGSKTPGKQNISSCPGGKCAPGKRVCFTAGTLVEMCDGTHRAIETLEEGELVWAWDEATGESDCRPIAETFARGTEMLLALRIVDDSGQVEQITTTAEHPFYRPELGLFVRADELAVGDALLSSSGAWLKVGSATSVQQSATVYNLTVDEFHTYFVGTSGVWVHNKAVYRPSNSQNNSSSSAQPGTYRPDRTLPRDAHGNPMPDSGVVGPHTQLGKRDGRHGDYTQAREFDATGRPVRDIDFTDHGRPSNHSNPHQHLYTDNPTGGTRRRSKEALPLVY